MTFIRHSAWVSAAVLCVLVGCAKSKNPTPPAAFSDVNPAISPAIRPTFQSVSNAVEAPTLRRVEDLFILGPGDRVEIEILGNAASRAITFVGPDGKIYYNLLRGQDVWGLTLAQTRDLLEKELGKYMGSPQVVVTLREVASRHIWLLGRLNRPGIYPMPGPMSLLESIATAGGLVFIAGTIDKRIRAFESRSGKLLWEAALDAEGHTNPMTYMGRNGKQYVVIVSSGVNAFALP